MLTRVAAQWSRFSLLVLLMLPACQKETAPAAPPAPAPAPVPDPAPAPAAAPGAGGGAAEGAPDAARKSKLAPAPTDGFSLAERMERRKADEAKLAAQLANDERERLLKYDKTKLPLHKKMVASINKIRASYDGAKSAAEVEKVQAKEQKPIEAAAKQLQAIDPKGGNSNVVTDYDVMLNLLATEYPQALAASFEGDKQPLAEHRAELDKRSKKIDDWLDALKKGK